MSSTFIDDQDLSQVKYNGSWSRGGSSNEHDSTVASSTVVGDSFTVSFTGNSIVVYGTIDVTSQGVQTNYSVDGSSPVTVTSQGGSGDTFNQQFWNSPILGLGDHRLTVQMVKVNSNPGSGEGTIWFDYFLITDPTIHSNSTKKRNVGVIVGGSIAGLVFLSAIIFGVLLLRKRRKRRSQHAREIFWPNHGGDVEPTLVAEVRQNSGSHATVQPFVSDSLSSPGNLSAGGAILPRKLANPDQNRTDLSDNPLFLSDPPEASIFQASRQRIQPGKHLNRTAPSPRASEPTVQHVDSGIRAIDPVGLEVSAPVEVPPVYSPI